MRDRDYKEDIRIDQERLDQEWIEQPSKYLYYSEALAEAILERDRRKQNVEVVRAQCDLRIRKKWDVLQPELKMTEGSVNSMIIKDSFYNKAVKLLNNSVFKVNILTSAKFAFDHRKKALENLVSLRITGFHSTPKISKQKKELQREEIHRDHTSQLTKRPKNQKTKTSKIKRLKRKR